jgi:hypothetical protein
MNTSKKHIVIYSHGFGVRKDDLGLLSDIAEHLPEVESILFDYFQIDEIKKTLTVSSFTDQIEKLHSVIDGAKRANPDATIDLICHSQGTIVAALTKPEGIRKTLLLSPVFDMSIERTIKRYSSKPDADIHIQGISRLPVLEGLTRLILPQYWTERQQIQSFKEYNEFAEKTELIAIEAAQDNVLPKVDLSELSSHVQIESISGDHNFNGKDRVGLIERIREILL